MGEAVWLAMRGASCCHAAYPIKAGRQTIGRSLDCDCCLNDQFVSRVHAEVEHGTSGLFIRDLDSENGVYVNGVRVTAHEFRLGDTLQLGRVVLDVVTGDDRAPIREDPDSTPAIADAVKIGTLRFEDARLTFAEREVLALLLRGLSEKDIAEIMHLSFHTVHTHIKHIYETFGVEGCRELMAIYLARALDRESG